MTETEEQDMILPQQLFAVDPCGHVEVMLLQGYLYYKVEERTHCSVDQFVA